MRKSRAGALVVTTSRDPFGSSRSCRNGNREMSWLMMLMQVWMGPKYDALRCSRAVLPYCHQFQGALGGGVYEPRFMLKDRIA